MYVIVRSCVSDWNVLPALVGSVKTYEMASYDRNESLYLDIRKLTDWQHAPNVKPFTVMEQG